MTGLGEERYVYDPVSRVVEGILAGNDRQQYTFDAFGNIRTVTTTYDGQPPTVETLAVDATTNRLSGAQYDAAGNQTGAGPFSYEFGPLGMMRRMTGGGNDRIYVYTADDERILVYDQGASPDEETYSLRDLDGQVLRTFHTDSGGADLVWHQDYVRNGGQLVSSVRRNPGGGADLVEHFHLDHLGTPRLITGDAGNRVHSYFPFGQELVPTVDDERMKFTGHERDLNLPGTADDLDYMHARYCNPATGRFLSVDPVGGNPDQPQSWNRYTYALDNPLAYVDPTGQSVWGTIVRVVKAYRGARRSRSVTVAVIKGKSKQKTVKDVRKGLDKITDSERSRGAVRVVETETDEARDAVAKQLSDNRKTRGPESSGPLPEHVHPDEGPYEDVHVQTTAKVVAGAGLGKALQEAVAPNLSALVEYGEATPGELLSAGIWDTVSAVEPLGVSELVNLYLDP